MNETIAPGSIRLLGGSLRHLGETLISTHRAHQFPVHAHETFAIGVALAGHSRLFIGGNVWEIDPGDLILIAPGELHTGTRGATASWSLGMVMPPVESLTALAPALVGAPAPRFERSVVRRSPLAAEVAAAFKRLAAGCRADEFARAGAELEDRIRAVFTAFAHVGRPSPPATVAADLRQFLDTHCEASLRVADLRAVTPRDPGYLSKVFRRQFGLTPYEYFMTRRVERARRLLREGTPPAAVAQAVGFADQSHLTRQYRRTIGVPPGRYQAEFRRSLGDTTWVGLPGVGRVIGNQGR